MFLWEVVHGKILCNTERKCRGFTTVINSCAVCQVAPETILHLLRDCEQAKRDWTELGGPAFTTTFLNQFCIKRWMFQNLQSKVTMCMVLYRRFYLLLLFGGCGNAGTIRFSKMKI